MGAIPATLSNVIIWLFSSKKAQKVPSLLLYEISPSCNKWNPVVHKEAKITLIAEHLIISFVDDKMSKYFGETMCTFIIDLSELWPKHEIVDPGIAITARKSN